ncbi:MAG TPA: serine--tRNA ligase [Dehalococcoidia bacterium]|nr:serine--tRNA ligase [Dehalococcoidia bacterium]
MIDPRSARQDPERLKEIIRLRKVDPAKANIDRWLQLDERRRQLQTETDALNAEKKQVAELGKTNPDAARARGQELREQTRVLEAEADAITAEWNAILQWFPNWIDPEMPHGSSEEDNVEECAWVPDVGYLPADRLGRGFDSVRHMPQAPIHAGGDEFKPLHYSEIGERLGGVDTLQAGKVSGSRFAYLIGDVAVMQIAIQRLLTDELLRRGYAPIVPPLLVRERALFGTSHFPEGRDQVYEIKTDNVEEPLPLFLVGSSEPANFSFFMDRTLDEAELPVKVFAFTPCFRSEAGSWGKDVKGIKRVHQFDKLEMNAVCTEDQAAGIYAEFREINEWLLQQLELPYRIVDKCTGDAGYLATHRQRDVEVWLSGSREYMEVMTDTNTTDYQARRLNIRYKGAGGTRLCNTVNDTGCAMGRMLIAIMDNYQQSDGSVLVPEILKHFMNKDRLSPRESPAPFKA